MTLLSELTASVQTLLQDTEERAWSEDRVRRAVLDEVAGLARSGHTGEVVQLRALASQGTYTQADGLDPRTAEIVEVLYDGSPLGKADERYFDQLSETWAQKVSRPFAWAQNLQGLTALRVVPKPSESGPDVPIFPPYPLLLPVQRNFVAFVLVDLLREDTAPDVDVGLPAGLDEVVVYGAVASLCDDASDFGDPIKAGAYRELSTLLSRLTREG